MPVNSGLEMTYKFSLEFWVMLQRKPESYPKTQYLEQYSPLYHILTTDTINPRAQTPASLLVGSHSA